MFLGILITKLRENDSLSVDRHTDGPYYIISQQNTFLHGENIKNELTGFSRNLK